MDAHMHTMMSIVVITNKGYQYERSRIKIHKQEIHAT